MKSKPVLLLHGGAGSRVTLDKKAVFIGALERILAHVFPILLNGESAVTSVVAAVRELEDNPLFNAGKGSKIQSDGHIRMSASVMDGSTRKFAGCINVEGLKNPVLLARELMNQEDRILSGQGARAFARSRKLKFSSPFTIQRKIEFAHKKVGKTGTVGAVAIDQKGHLAAATSTGGKGFELPYRVSDSATVAGNFANKLCAVSATGIGEDIVELAVAATLGAYLEAGMPLDKAVTKMILTGRQQKRSFGLIAIDQSGEFQVAKTTPSIIWAAASTTGINFF